MAVAALERRMLQAALAIACLSPLGFGLRGMFLANRVKSEATCRWQPDLA